MITAPAHQISQEAQGFAITVLFLAIVLASVIVAARPAQAQMFEVLYSFQGSPDASGPTGPFVRDAAGNFFSTSAGGGTFGQGTAFKLSGPGKETVLYSFCLQLYCHEGGNPTAGLAGDTQGNLYGTASGGSFDTGFVFQLSPTGGEVVLYNFTGAADGAFPDGRLLRDAEGNLYGNAAGGGAYRNCGLDNAEGCGVVFKVTTTGTEAVLYNFTGGADGAQPVGALVRDQKGNFYGATLTGGKYGYGTVFRLDGGGNETVLHSFRLNQTGHSDGANPNGDLIRDSKGNLYGTTSSGGNLNSDGVVFKLSKTGKETVLYRFQGGLDGIIPLGGLVRDLKGNLYGTTVYGGGYENCYNYGCGTVFKVDTAGREIALHRFTGGADGGNPPGGLFRDAQGISTARLPTAAFQRTARMAAELSSS